MLAEKNPRTKIPDSEICIENIIPGSPSHVPYKRKKGKDSKGSELNNTVHDLGMARTKQTPRLSEMTEAHDKKARDLKDDLHARRLASTHKNRKTTHDGKAPCKQLATKATQKGGAAAAPTKPHCNWSILAICEIKFPVQC